jgi:hypothetical protein
MQCNSIIRLDDLAVRGVSDGQQTTRNDECSIREPSVYDSDVVETTCHPPVGPISVLQWHDSEVSHTICFPQDFFPPLFSNPLVSNLDIAESNVTETRYVPLWEAYFMRQRPLPRRMKGNNRHGRRGMLRCEQCRAWKQKVCNFLCL